MLSPESQVGLWRKGAWRCCMEMSQKRGPLGTPVPPCVTHGSPCPCTCPSRAPTGAGPMPDDSEEHTGTALQLVNLPHWVCWALTCKMDESGNITLSQSKQTLKITQYMSPSMWVQASSGRDRLWSWGCLCYRSLAYVWIFMSVLQCPWDNKILS